MQTLLIGFLAARFGVELLRDAKEHKVGKVRAYILATCFYAGGFYGMYLGIIQTIPNLTSN